MDRFTWLSRSSIPVNPRQNARRGTAVVLTLFELA